MTKEKNKGGRPKTVLTDEQIAKLEERSAYLNCEQIADSFGISHTAFQDIRARQPEVLLAYKKGKTEKIYRYAKKLENKAMGIDEAGDTASIIFFLKTRAGWSTEPKNDDKIKLKFPDSKTPADILDTALSALENGEITLNEAGRIADLAIAKLNILNKTDVTQQAVIERESEEQLMDKIYTIRKVLEHHEKQNKGN